MSDTQNDNPANIGRFAPFHLLSDDVQQELDKKLISITVSAGEIVYSEEEDLEGLYLIEEGMIDTESTSREIISRKGSGDIFGQRGLMRDGKGRLTARAVEDTRLFQLPKDDFYQLLKKHPAFAAWFDRAKSAIPLDNKEASDDLAIVTVSELMLAGSVTCPGTATVSEAARTMRSNNTHSAVVVDDEGPVGIVTTTDLATKVLAEDLNGDVLVSTVMTPRPITIESDALGVDALALLSEHNIRQIPVVKNNNVVGIVDSAILLERKADSTSSMIVEILGSKGPDEMANVTARIPGLLTQLVGSGAHPNRVGRRITDITDAVTRRLLVLAEEKLGTPPVPYLWLACGSQGRREQTGVSDQDNCLILDDAFSPDHESYFEKLAAFVTDGLNTCGYVYCPGDMMARNPKWCQPRRIWQKYFTDWVNQPDKMAQMLASVMFDLRPISGEVSLFVDLQDKVLKLAKKNSIFVAHMVANSVHHEPPISIFGGLALIRSGDNKNTIDLKHSGVVPIIDLARIYAIQGGLKAVGTSDRLEQARDQGIISQSGAHDLIDAYNLIAQTRLQHQAEQARSDLKPDNFISPRQLSELERNHLRDAFSVIKSMQSSLSHSRSILG